MSAKFNQAYSELIRKLPPSLENEAWKRLISRKRNPITEEDASTVNPLIESFLNHEVDRYQKRIKFQRQSWPSFENLSNNYKKSMDKETQTFDIIPICNQTRKCPCFACEDDIKNQVSKEVEILCQQILKYNQEIFVNFMQKLDKEYEERINTNKKLRSEIEEKKIELDEAEKILASMKADATD
ncbi:17629_t:CDS:1 [Entrophospora sp. SA101]|nr:17629_t:CDS:1 [Entrophospora sp. SA101]